MPFKYQNNNKHNLVECYYMNSYYYGKVEKVDILYNKVHVRILCYNRLVIMDVGDIFALGTCIAFGEIIEQDPKSCSSFVSFGRIMQTMAEYALVREFASNEKQTKKVMYQNIFPLGTTLQYGEVLFVHNIDEQKSHAEPDFDFIRAIKINQYDYKTGVYIKVQCIDNIWQSNNFPNMMIEKNNFLPIYSKIEPITQNTSVIIPLSKIKCQPLKWAEKKLRKAEYQFVRGRVDRMIDILTYRIITEFGNEYIVGYNDFCADPTKFSNSNLLKPASQSIPNNVRVNFNTQPSSVAMLNTPNYNHNYMDIEWIGPVKPFQSTTINNKPSQQNYNKIKNEENKHEMNRLNETTANSLVLASNDSQSMTQFNLIEHEIDKIERSIQPGSFTQEMEQGSLDKLEERFKKYKFELKQLQENFKKLPSAQSIKNYQNKNNTHEERVKLLRQKLKKLSEKHKKQFAK